MNNEKKKNFQHSRKKGGWIEEEIVVRKKIPNRIKLRPDERKNTIQQHVTSDMCGR